MPIKGFVPTSLQGSSHPSCVASAQVSARKNIQKSVKKSAADGSRRAALRRTRGSLTTIEAHSATSAPDFLVYRRAVGDGRASKPHSRRGIEFRLQRRRTRCPSYKREFHHDRNPIGNVCTRFPRLPPSRRRRPGLQTAIATRCRIPPPAATDKMSVVQRRDPPRLKPNRQRLHTLSSFTAEP